MYRLFFILFGYTFVFHWYPYFFPWISPDQPSAPLLIIISRDLLFILVLAVFFYRLTATGFSLKNLNYRPVSAVFLFYFFLFIVLLFGALHTNLSEFMQHNVRNMMMYLLIIPVFFYVADSYDRAVTIKVSKIFLVMGTLLSLFGIGTLLFFDQELLWSGIRIYSLMGNPNTFGLFLIIPGLIATALIIQDVSTRLKIIMSLVIVLNSIALILTISFQSVISYIFALCLLVFLFKGRKIIAPLTVIFLFLAALFYFIYEYYYTFIDFIFFKLEDPTSTSITGRIEQLHYVIDRLKDIRNWPFGVFSLKEYMLYDSQYYNIIINNGLIALFLYLAPPFLVILLGLKYKKTVIDKEDPWLVSMYMSSIVFLIVTLMITANLTAFMQRYPINLYYFLFLAIILHSVCCKLTIVNKGKVLSNKV